MKVTKQDLTGEIEDFYLEVVQWMCEQQVAQGNEFNPKVFQKHKSADSINGGFDWDRTDISYYKCREIILYKNFDLFFKTNQSSY